MYVEAWSPEVKTKCPARNAPTSWSTCNTSASFIILLYQRCPDFSIKFVYLIARGDRKILITTGENNGSRRANNEPAVVRILPKSHALHEIAILGSNARQENGEIGSNGPHFSELLRVRCANYEPTITIRIPAFHHMPRDDFVERLTLYL